MQDLGSSDTDVESGDSSGEESEGPLTGKDLFSSVIRKYEVLSSQLELGTVHPTRSSCCSSPIVKLRCWMADVCARLCVFVRSFVCIRLLVRACLCTRTCQ